MTFKMVLEEMATIYEAKNSDYGNSFELSARLLDQPVIIGLLHRMTDKLSRACRLAAGVNPQVRDEVLRDTLLDLANYTVLGILTLHEKDNS